jgi:hypothetical protein
VPPRRLAHTTTSATTALEIAAIATARVRIGATLCRAL